MLLLGVSEFVANSAAVVYYTAGALQANFTDKAVRPFERGGGIASVKMGLGCSGGVGEGEGMGGPGPRDAGLS